LKKELFLSESDYRLIKFTKNEKTKIIRFNNPKKMNTMDSYLCREIYNILQNSNNSELLVFIGEESNKLFSCGGDLKFFYDTRNNYDTYLTFSNLCYNLFFNLKENFSENTVTIYNGVAMGGGMSLGLFSKFRVATESTILAMPETKFGFVTNCIFNTLVKKFLTYKEALHFCLFSLQFRSYETYLKKFATHFILNKYIPDLLKDLQNLKSLDETENILNYYHSKSIEEMDPEIKVKSEKRLKSWDKQISSIYNFEIDPNNFLDFYEILKFNLKSLESKFFKELLDRSILTLQVNFDVINSGYDENLTYEDRVNIDLQACMILSYSGNIFEGIRAFFVDKDFSPRWRAKF
jgi:3-hydroxyisobutyryl-CoA hydrolase